jgi:hypothetical protein
MQRMWIAAALVLGGCPAQPPECIAVDTACAPLYVPTFDNVFAMTLEKKCGSAACHSRSTKAGGMSFEDPQHAYDALLAGRVTSGDPGCSDMIVRTSSPGADYQMPPGSALIPSERCALIQWVAAGAPGPGEPLPMTSGVAE